MATASTTLIVLTELAGNKPATLNALQAMIAPYLHDITLAWVSLWCATLVVVLVVLWKKIREPAVYDVPDTVSLPALAIPFGGIFSRLRSAYRSLFSIQEFESSAMLRWLYGAMLFGFYTSFGNWIFEDSITVETARAGNQLCWVYFQNCADWYFLHVLPYGYSQTTLYMALYAVMLLCVYAMWKRWWTLAHVGMLILFVWKVLVMFVLTADIQGGPNYHHVFLTLILLFVPKKTFFAQLMFLLIYFLAVVIKLDSSWILGQYFTSLQSGLAFFGNSAAPLFTNAVIAMQIVGSWFLMSGRTSRRYAALTIFTCFHLYSGIYVGYTYPVLALSILWILFGPLYTKEAPPFTRASTAGWFAILALFAFHLPGHLIQGDQRLTQEGNRFGLNLFDANHQCVNELTIYATSTVPVKNSSWALKPRQVCSDYVCLTATSVESKGASVIVKQRWESAVSWQRCSAYSFWYRAKARNCSGPGVEKVSMRFIHSIDGGPFYEIINEDNICHLEFRPFSHNDWVRLPPEAPVVGYPLKNVFRYTRQGGAPFGQPYETATTTPGIIALNEIVGNDVAQLTGTQRILSPYLSFISFAWKVVWATMLALALNALRLSYKRRART